MKRQAVPSSTSSKRIAAPAGALAKRKTVGKQRMVSLSRVPRGVGFPKLLRTKLRYVDSVSLASTTGSLARNHYRCNGLFDPDASGVGHQPLYYDNLAAIYNHYVVTASKITLRFSSNFDSNAVMCAGVYINNDLTVVPVSFVDASEQSSAAYGILGGDKHTGLVITKSWSAKQNWGGSILANTNLEGNLASDPTEQQIYTVYASMMNASDSGSCSVLVTIEYDCVWREVKDQVFN